MILASSHSVRLLASLSVLGWLVASCGGSQPTTTEPATPAAKTAEAAEPSGSAAATSDPASAKSNADLVEGKNTPNPKKLPVVRIDAPGNDQRVPGHYAQDYKIRYKVTNWSAMPEGSYLQFILDDVPYRPVTDPKQTVKLKELAGGGDIAEGEHIIAAYVARKNHESIKAERAVSVRRFWVGKKTESSWSAAQDPLLIVGRPHGTYQGEEVSKILVDYYVINAVLADDEHTIRFTLTGPGIEADGIKHTVSEWRPLLVWSPSDGEHTLKAELLDAKAQPVDVPWNPVTRKFTVKR